MAFKTTKYIIRPSENIPFYRDAFPRSIDHINYMDEKFVSTGKLVETKTTISEDKLMCIIEAIWDSQESFNEFINDLYCIEQYIIPAQLYEEENNFVSYSEVEEV